MNEYAFHAYEVIRASFDFPTSVVGFWIPVLGSSLVIILMIHFCKRRGAAAEEVYEDTDFDEAEETPGTRKSGKPKYRFRKRDKVLFYGRKFLRKINIMNEDGSDRSGSGTPVSVGGGGGGGGRKVRKKVRRPRVLDKMNTLARLFRANKPVSFPRTIKRPPAGFLEETKGPFPDVPEGLSPDIFYLLRNISSSNLCVIPKGSYLFEPGQTDDSIFVVVKGQLAVYLRDGDKEYQLKCVGEGESVFSLLSVLDVMTGCEGTYKTAAAKALEDCSIVRLKARGFRDAFESNPEQWVRAVQVIVIRLLHVTMTTLHNYLGMSTELTKPSLRPGGKVRERGRHRSGDTGVHPQMDLGRRDSAPVYRAQRSTGATTDEEGEGGIVFKPRLASVSGSGESTGASEESGGRGERLLFVRQQSAEKKIAMEQIARRALGDALGLGDHLHLLDGKSKLESLPNNFEVLKQGDTETCLIYVLSGCLELLQKSIVNDEMVLDSLVWPQEMVGGLAVLSGEPSFYTIRARQKTHIVKIPRKDFYEIMAGKPRVVLTVAHTVVKRLSPFVRAIDFALDWEMCESGQALFTQGSPSEYLFVVLSGRLRSVVKSESGKKELADEFGRGDMVGMLEVFTQKPRTTTVMAIRYSELAKIPEGLLNYIKVKHPQVLLRVIQLLGDAISGYHQKLAGPSMDTFPNIRNLHTIAIVGVNDEVPVTAFSMELWHALNAIRRTLLLSSQVIKNSLGAASLESGANDFQLLHWLNMQEDAYSVVIYQSDSYLSDWTRRCIRQADCVLIVARGDSKPDIGPLEEELERSMDMIRAQKELILLWPQGTREPRKTAEWLDARGWISTHHHVRAPPRMYRRLKRDKIMEMYEKTVFSESVDKFSDFSRLARQLTGNSIGLVLGGGGARGASHVGILKAMKELGIPVDIVAGVSIGALIGGLLCQERLDNLDAISDRARTWFMKMTSTWTRICDLTYPHAAIMTGRAFNNTLRDLFGEAQLEDLWIPYFTISTDITASEMRVHRNGTLWSYCRASMSLAGYLPPLCDPVDGHLLVDGGYVNNVPADVMKSLGVKWVIAVDVASPDDQVMTNYGTELSGTWVFLNKWNPWGSALKVPNMAEIQSRLAYISCIRMMEQVKKAGYCHLIRPPIDKYATLDFKLYDEIMDVGYKHGRAVLELWASDTKKLKLIAGVREKSRDSLSEETELDESGGPYSYLPRPPSGMLNRSTPSFTDLAAMVTKIQAPKEAPGSDEELSDLLEEEGNSGSEGGSWMDEMESEELRPDETEENLSVTEEKTDEESLTEADRKDPGSFLQ